MNLKSVGGAGAEIVSRGRGAADQPWGMVLAEVGARRGAVINIA